MKTIQQTSSANNAPALLPTQVPRPTRRALTYCWICGCQILDGEPCYSEECTIEASPRWRRVTQTRYVHTKCSPGESGSLRLPRIA